MKKLLMMMFAMLIVFNISAQEVSSVQWSQIQKKTADWCPPCGTWGWEFFEDMLETYHEQPVLTWATHYSGGLSNNTTIDLAANYSANGQPIFFINGANIFLGSSNSADKKELIQQTIDVNNSFTPFQGCGVDATYNGNTVSVNGRAELFAASGELKMYMGLYLMRKETIASQATRGSDALHKNLVIAHLTDDVFGTLLVDVDSPAGSEYFMEATYDFPDETIENYNLVSILWAKIDDNYHFLNANVQDIEMSSGIEDEQLKSTKLVIDAVTDQQLDLNIDSQSSHTDATLSIYNMAGNIISESITSIDAGANTSTIQLNNLPAGMYILTLNTGKHSISERFIMN